MDARDRSDLESSDRVSEVYELLDLTRKAQQIGSVWEAGRPADLAASGGHYVTRISNTSRVIAKTEGHAELE
jgi:hypothetical protein